jgi:hypothetical protein
MQKLTLQKTSGAAVGRDLSLINEKSCLITKILTYSAFLYPTQLCGPAKWATEGRDSLLFYIK